MSREQLDSKWAELLQSEISPESLQAQKWWLVYEYNLTATDKITVEELQ